jgi:ABC-type sugar transport system substrate-binding protein
VGLQGYTDYVSAYLEGQIGGIIFIGTEDQTPDPDSIRILQNEHAPLVVFNCKQDADTYSTVDYDYAGGARLIAERVMATGPKRLLYFEPQIDTEQERQREQGIREVASAHPDVELKIRQAPITKDRIEIWDAHHFVGDTEEGIRLTERFIEACRQALDELGDGDAVIASWATWTHYFRKADPDKKIVYAELANNGESWMAANFYTRMPNYGAGITCADEVLSLIGGSTPQSRLIKLTNIVTVTSLDL